jgi:hypothetical protein
VIERLEKAGLGYSVAADATGDKLGRRVAVPPSRSGSYFAEIQKKKQLWFEIKRKFLK